MHFISLSLSLSIFSFISRVYVFYGIIYIVEGGHTAYFFFICIYMVRRLDKTLQRYASTRLLLDDMTQRPQCEWLPQRRGAMINGHV